ncbi:hypothetical protein EG329_009041 [Mollisiaceae sp. DMI_Dod_QoI]|nr:hypothetical protein EG329_009041 [Helotiales sp. DMI_Dod_QoI]
MLLRPLSLYLFTFLSSATAALPPIHYTISRRGGSFPAPDAVNLTYLLEQVTIVEDRFGATTRAFQGNKVVRKPKRLHGTQAGTALLGEAGREGNWYASLHIGEPIQEVDMDLDMLTVDWWILSTSSDKGSFFLDFNSKTYVDSESHLAFPTCRQPKDVVHLPTIHRSVPISFAHCRPSKQWIRTLLPSGAYLGLAPSVALSQTKTISLMPQLIEKHLVDVPIWSILLVNEKEGIFSIGGTSVASVRQVERESEDALTRIGRNQNHKRGYIINDPPSRTSDDQTNNWNWLKVQGAEGWWQTLMRGVWADGIKILESQPIVLDLNSPFIIAPPLAARTLYSSISGSKQLSPPYDQFYAYPCFNRPTIHFEFAQWNVEVLKGGRFSLGRMAIGSGYCIGVIIESRMNTGTANSRDANSGVHIEGGNGISDAWILGEPFFRDVQVAFDWRDKLIGMQRV